MRRAGVAVDRRHPERLASTLTDVLEGRVVSLRDLARAEPADVAEAGAELAPLTLGSDAAAKVLTAYLSGRLSAEEAQGWASFVRRGYLAGTSVASVRPLDIEYEADAEDEIAEVIARLDELGDSVDGEISEEEGRQLLALLTR